MLTLFLILVVVALVFGIGAALKVAFWALLIAAILIALVVFGVRGALGRRT
jgi:hypothetical protein